MSVYIDKEKFCEKCKMWYNEHFFNKKCPGCERKKYEIKRLKNKEKKTLIQKIFECIKRKVPLHSE